MKNETFTKTNGGANYSISIKIAREKPHLDSYIKAMKTCYQTSGVDMLQHGE